MKRITLSNGTKKISLTMKTDATVGSTIKFYGTSWRVEESIPV